MPGVAQSPQLSTFLYGASIGFWCVAALVALLLRRSRSHTRRFIRRRALTHRSGNARHLLAGVFAFTAVVFSALLWTNRLQWAEKPVREALWYVHAPRVPRVLPPPAIIDVRSRHMPFPLIAGLLRRAHDAGAKAIVLVPPGQAMNVRRGARELVGPVPSPPDTGDAVRTTNPAEGLAELRRVVAQLDSVFVAYDYTHSFGGGVAVSGGEQDRVGHLRPIYTRGLYQALDATADPDGVPAPTVCAMLVAHLQGTPPESVRVLARERVQIGASQVRLAPGGHLLIAPQMVSERIRKLPIYSPAHFARRKALEGPNAMGDTTWEELCRGKIVFIGNDSALGAGWSRLRIAYDAANTLALAMQPPTKRLGIAGVPPRPIGRPAASALLLVILALTTLIGMSYRPAHVTVILLLVAVALTCTTLAVFMTSRILLPLGSLLLSLSAAGLMSGEVSWLLGEMQRSRVLEVFGRYVSPNVATRVLREKTVHLGGHSRLATIMFADIRGFGHTAEALPPEELVSLLNEHLSAMVDVVFHHDGTLDKFLGDAVMAVWGAPVSQPDDALRAVNAALDIRDRIHAISAARSAKGLPTVQVAVGINTGEVVAGNVGDSRRMEYTVIGDAVNVASRLQDIASAGEADIIISQSTFERVADDIRVRHLGVERVKHRDAPVAIYEVLGARDSQATD